MRTRDPEFSRLEPEDAFDPDAPSAREDAPARSRALSLLENGQLERTPFAWFRDWWPPASVARIEAWGDALFALMASAMFKKGLRARRDAEAAVNALRALRRRTPWTGWRQRGLPQSARRAWAAAVTDMFHAAGLRCDCLEDIALELVARGWFDLALRVAAVEEYLLPDEAGPTRAHVLAAAGQRERGIAALKRIAQDAAREPWTRGHAKQCLKLLETQIRVRARRWR
jgi:hypothetical protein